MTIGLLNKCGILTSRLANLVTSQYRTVVQIPPWEHHIIYSPIDGRKRPNQDVLNRFKRLNNGMWIRAHPGRRIKRYWKQEWWREKADQHYTATSMESQMLHRMVNNFWLRPKYYVNDLYEPYNVRHGLKAPRVDYNGQYVGERKKILLEDTVADQHFYDR